jgi:alpha-N-arabinofuranosidase
MQRSCLSLPLIVVLGVAASAAAQPDTPAAGYQATVAIDREAAPKPFSPLIFGGFLEHFDRQIYGGVFEPGSPLADTQGFRTDVIEALKELKVPVIRWPGGCFVDSYHWQRGVGKNRQSYDDDRWGVVEPNTFGTDEFVALCRRLNAEPYICQNGLADVREMADWVAYCNATSGPFAAMRRENGHAEPFHVRYWSVGNERSGKEYIDRVRDAAIAMKMADPSIQVTCSGAHGPNAAMDPYLFQAAGKHLDLISVHEYWIPNYRKHQTPDYLTCMMLAEKPDAHLLAAIRSLDGGGVRGRLKIAFDEWNLRSWHHPGFSGHRPRKVDDADPAVMALIKAREKSDAASLYTMADALFCASFLNACLRHSEDVGMANIAPLVNATGPLFVHPDGIVKRTHFHVLAMYANLLEGSVAEAGITADRLTHEGKSVAVVDAVATVSATGGAWAIALVNRHPADAVDCRVLMNGAPLEGTFTATVLAGDSADVHNDVEHPDRVKPEEMNVSLSDGIIRLPPHSLTIMRNRPAAARPCRSD